MKAVFSAIVCCILFYISWFLFVKTWGTGSLHALGYLVVYLVCLPLIGALIAYLAMCFFSWRDLKSDKENKYRVVLLLISTHAFIGYLVFLTEKPWDYHAKLLVVENQLKEVDRTCHKDSDCMDTKTTFSAFGFCPTRCGVCGVIINQQDREKFEAIKRGFLEKTSNYLDCSNKPCWRLYSCQVECQRGLCGRTRNSELPVRFAPKGSASPR